MTPKISAHSLRERLSTMTLPAGIREFVLYYNKLASHQKSGLPLRSMDYIFMHAFMDLRRVYDELALVHILGASELDISTLLLSDIPNTKEFAGVRAFMPGYYAMHDFLNEFNTLKPCYD